LPIYDPPGFQALVQQAIGTMQAGQAEKIVLSRLKATPLPPDFNPVLAFLALCRHYPHAFVSLINLPDGGVWLGASPEILLNINLEPHRAHLRTVALAGTQTRPENGALQAVRWSAKEVREQDLVSQYIRHFFESQPLPPGSLSETGPRTVSAGNVVHRQSEFQVTLPPRQALKLGQTMLTALHPTSAVCGMPHQTALNFILQNEKHPRDFYSGFLGPVHWPATPHSDRRQTEIYVNLRCMQLFAERGLLYVGAGITSESDPQAEWGETDLKAQTLLNVLEGVTR
jgi:isochorismate synthase